MASRETSFTFKKKGKHLYCVFRSRMCCNPSFSQGKHIPCWPPPRLLPTQENHLLASPGLAQPCIPWEAEGPGVAPCYAALNLPVLTRVQKCLAGWAPRVLAVKMSDGTPTSHLLLGTPGSVPGSDSQCHLTQTLGQAVTMA